MQLRLTTKQTFITALVLAMLAFLVIFGIYYRQLQHEKDSTALISNTQDLLFYTERISVTAAEIETSARGYLLTGHQPFLEAYHKAKKDIPREAERLKELAEASSTFQQHRIDSLLQYVAARTFFSDSIIREKQTISLQAAIDLVATGSGKLYLDNIRRLVVQMQQDEKKLLEKRKKENEAEIIGERIVLFAIAFIMLVLLVVLFWKEKQHIEQKERKKTQGELEFLSLQINQAHDAIYIVDAALKIQSWNKGAEKLYGFSKEEVLDKNPNDLLQTVITDEELDAALKKINKEDHWTGELQRKIKTGQLIYVRSSTTTIRDNEGKVTGYVAVSYDITGQKQLREQVSHLANIVEQSSEAIISGGLDQRIISWNRGAEQLFGYTKEEAIGKSVPELQFGKIADTETSAIAKQVAQKGIWEDERVFFHKNGSSFFGAITGNRVTNERGEISSLVFIVKDISTRKQLEEQLTRSNEELEEKIRIRTEEIKSSEKKYRYLFENNPMPMWVIDLKDFRFLDVNKMATLQYGYSREEFLAMTATDIRPEEDKELFINSDHIFKTNAANYNRGIWRHKKKNGAIILVEIVAHEIIFDGIPARFILANDITERKKVEEKLVASEERFRALIENNYDIITLMDASFKVIYRSPSTYRITGWSNEEMIHSNGTKNIHPDDIEYFHAVIMEIMTKPGKSMHTSFRSRHKNGNYLRLEGTLINLLQQEHVQAIVFNSRDVTERFEAEEKLKASEEQFRTSMDNMLEGVQIHDFNWKYIYVNNALVKYSTYSKEELLGYTLMEKYPGIEQSDLFKTLNRCMLERTAEHTEIEFVFPNGKKADYELSIQPIPEGLFILSIDITERKKADERLQFNEKRFRTLIEDNHDIITLMDDKFKVFYRSPSAARITGWSDEEMEESSGTNKFTIHPDDWGKADSMMRECIANPGKPIYAIYRNLHKNGHYIWLEGTMTNLLHNEYVNAVLFNFRDVTKRIETEEKIVSSEVRFRSLIENIADAIVLNDEETNIIYQSPSVTRILGYEPEERQGKKVMDYIHPDNRAEIINLYEELKMVKNKPLSFQYRFLHKNGNYIWLEGVVTNLMDNPAVKAYVANYRDITERKETEIRIKNLNAELEERVVKRTEQLRKTNEELEAFSYSVSHDLRAPLRAIIGFSAILEEDYGARLDDEAKRITAIIKTNTTKMGSLIDDLLAFSRMGRQDIIKAEVNSTELVQETIANEHRKEHDKDIQWIIHSLPVVKADINTLRQVWINLISNAAKYSGKNEAPEVEIGSFKHENGQLVFFVKDNGVGFDDKYKNKLFKVFQRLHSNEEFEGTGIGLAIIEKIISKHGGSVWAEAAVNKGATFYFSLPDE